MPDINAPPPDGQSLQDTKLLEQIARARARGDKEAERLATGELIAGWLPRVEAFARFKGLPAHQIDDAVGRWSERMLRALARRTRFDGPFGAVAMMNANWACLDERAQQHLEREIPFVEPHDADPIEPSEEAVDPDLQSAVDAAIASLTDREPAIIAGVFDDDKTRRAVADDVGMREGAVKTALYRALAKVRAHLRAAGVTKRGGPPG